MAYCSSLFQPEQSIRPGHTEERYLELRHMSFISCKVEGIVDRIASRQHLATTFFAPHYHRKQIALLEKEPFVDTDTRLPTIVYKKTFAESHR